MTPKLNPMRTKLLSLTKWEGEETLLFNVLGEKKVLSLFISIRRQSRSSYYISDAKYFRCCI